MQRLTNPAFVGEYVSRQNLVGRLSAAAKRKFSESCWAKTMRKLGAASLQKAATLGCVGAHEWLGYVYDYGFGTRPNRRLSMKHYMTAAEAGNANAEYHVGVFYHEGIAVRKNYRAAVLWFRRGAEHRDATALHALGKAYRYGWGVQKNHKKGFKLELQAAQRGESRGPILGRSVFQPGPRSCPGSQTGVQVVLTRSEARARRRRSQCRVLLRDRSRCSPK